MGLFRKNQSKILCKVLSFLIIFVLSFSLVFLANLSYARDFINLPEPDAIAAISGHFTPTLIKGVSIDVDNPFKFDFIVDTGDTSITGAELKTESTKLIKYFLASLTTPEDQAWVNLSPYEKGRIISEGFGKTTMGRDLLAQDYVLKQVSAAISNPKEQLGEEFWNRVHQKAQEQFGSTDIPLNTFNKIWIVPQDALVYEKDNTAFVVKSHLKVYLEEDYLALQKNTGIERFGIDGGDKADVNVVSGVTSQIVKEVLIPEIEKEVNTGKTFANLRQIYNSVILATWYKNTLRNSILSKVYVDQNKVAGVNVEDEAVNQEIYNKYVAAFKKGVYNFIREEYDQATQELIPRKYFSGGLRATIDPNELKVTHNLKQALEAREDEAMPVDSNGKQGRQFDIEVDTLALNADSNLAEFDQAPFVQASDLEDNSMVVQGGLAVSGNPYVGTVDFSRRYLERARDNRIRVRQINFILREIAKERENPGTGQLPRYEALSDFHGDVNRFTALLSNALNRLIGFEGQLDPNRFIKEQLDAQGLSLKEMQGAIILGGDLFDRGEHGIKCALVAMELKELAPDHVVFMMGNHDKWMEGNMNGVHLPWYQGFHWYLDKGTDKEKQFKKEARDLVEKMREENPDQLNSFSEWTKWLAEFNDDMNAYNKTALKGKASEIRDTFLKFYEKFKGEWNDQQFEAIERFAGYFKRISVPNPAIGLKGIANTNSAWWESTFEQLKKAKETRAADGAASDETSKWAEAIRLAKQISVDLNKRLEKRLAEGKFWFKAIEAINTEAYKSEEWWSKDWSSHIGWGEKVIAELNQMIADGIITDEDIDEFDQSNYIHSKTLKQISDFYANNFNLHFFTIYRDLFSHGWFPVTDDGEIVINYKGKEYRNNKIFQGFDQMTADVRDPGLTMQEKWEARSLVNSWYADMTTQLKPIHIKKNREEIGINIIHGNLKIANWVTGHNPLRKLKTTFMTKTGKYAHFEMDKGMSPKFGEEGGLVSIGPDGINLWGFSPAKEAKVENIVRSPLSPILEGKKITGEYENPGLSGEEFLDTVEELLSQERAEIIGQDPEKYFISKGDDWRTKEYDDFAMATQKVFDLDGEMTKALERLRPSIMDNQVFNADDLIEKAFPDMEASQITVLRGYMVSWLYQEVQAEDAKLVAVKDGGFKFKNLGGINLNPDLIKMEIKRDGKGIILPLDQQPYFNAEIEGLLPVIINVTPISIPLLLGLDADRQESKELAAL